jgi:pyruvate,water dikinase
VGEDSEVASHAGEYCTKLNVVGFAEVVEAIRLVVGSVGSEGALAYRLRLGIREAPRMAVAIQRMVFADCSGVMFTRHPVTGAEETVIEASWGLGEAVVQGLVIPDLYRLKPDGTSIETRPGTKDLRIEPLPEGGTTEVSVADDEEVCGLCLDEAHLAGLVSLARGCEKHFGSGRDVEWAYEDGTLYVLQCRAITSGTRAVAASGRYRPD